MRQEHWTFKVNNIQRVLVLIGLMGAGKTSIGKRLAGYLNLDFVDADAEIVKIANCTISDFFKLYGENEFRKLEESVINRLLLNGPMVLATGGGAYMNPSIRNAIKKYGISIWLHASLDVLVKRTSGRTGRPLLKDGDPQEILKKLIDERYPVYSGADLTLKTDGESIQQTLDSIVAALHKHSDKLNRNTK